LVHSEARTETGAQFEHRERREGGEKTVGQWGGRRGENKKGVHEKFVRSPASILGKKQAGGAERICIFNVSCIQILVLLLKYYSDIY
jgi:hypothetical protein